MLDTRTEVYVQIDGTVMPVLEGSTTDSGLASSGLVRTTGELVLAGAIAVPVGALVRMAYRTPVYYGAMPRPRLRVLACHQDPLRGITKLRLGCALAWKWSQAAPRATDTDLDPDDPALDIHKAASDWLTEAFAGAGLRCRAVPALSTHILKTWRWSEGYLAAAAEILETFGYLGFTGPDEVIDIISLSDGGSLAGPTLDIEDILDTKPLSTSGTVGREFHSTGLSYSSGVSARSASSVANSTTNISAARQPLHPVESHHRLRLHMEDPECPATDGREGLGDRHASGGQQHPHLGNQHHL